MAKSRIAESYVQIAVVITDMADSIAEQIRKGYEEGTEDANKKTQEQVEEPAKKGGASWATGFATAILASGAIAGIGAKLSESIVNGLEVRKINNKMAAALTLTDIEREKIEEASKSLFSKAYGESYDEVAAAMTAVVSTVSGARKATSIELEKMGRDVLNVASTWDVGVEEINRAAEIMINTGIAKNWDDAISQIAGGFQTLGASGADWLDTLIEFSDDFAKFGLSGESAVGLIKSAMDAGLKDTDKFADALNELSITLMEGGKTDDIIKGIGIDPKKMRENIKKGGDAARSELINVLGALQKDGDVGNFQKLMSSIGEDFQSIFMNMDLTNVQTQFQGVTGDMAELDRVLNEGGVTSIVEMERAFESLFAEVAIPLFNEFLPYLQSFVKFLQENEWAVKLLAAVIGTALVLAVVALTIAMWNFAVAAWAAAIPLAPIYIAIILIVAAVVAVIAIIVLLWDYWDDIFNWIGAAVMWVIKWIEELGRVVAEAMGGFMTWLLGDVFNMDINASTSENRSVAYTADTSGLPQLAAGATIKARPGGTAVVVGEGGRDESVVDTGKINNLINSILVDDRSSDTRPNMDITIVQKENQSTEDLVRAIDEYYEMNSMRGT